jgi:beta-lactamase class A
MAKMLGKIAIAEGIVILFLVILSVHLLLNEKVSTDTTSEGLLSPRVYSGLLPAESHLIFNLKPLEDALNLYIEKEEANVSVYIVNLRDGASIGIRENQQFEPLSLNKLPLAIIILEKVEQGELSMDEKIKIREEFVDNSSGTLYERNLSELSIKELLYYMLADSDNTAADTLLSLTSSDEVTRLSTYLNYYPSLKKGEITFSTSPKSNYNIFMSLYLSTILTAEHSEFIMSALANSTFNIHSLAGIPEDVVIAHKYGGYYFNDEERFHSCGIMYLNQSRFFYCVMTASVEPKKANEITGNIVHGIYTYVISAQANIKNYKV